MSVAAVRRDTCKRLVRQYKMNLKDWVTAEEENKRKIRMRDLGIAQLKAIFVRIRNIAKAACLEGWVLNYSAAMEEESDDDEAGLIKEMQDEIQRKSLKMIKGIMTRMLHLALRHLVHVWKVDRIVKAVYRRSSPRLILIIAPTVGW